MDEDETFFPFGYEYEKGGCRLAERKIFFEEHAKKKRMTGSKRGMMTLANLVIPFSSLERFKTLSQTSPSERMIIIRDE